MLIISNLFVFISKSYRPERLLFLFMAMVVIAILYAVACFYIGVGQPLNEQGETIQLLDTLFNYTLEQAYQHLTAYQEQGRIIYLVSTLFLDSLFPLAYGVFFALLLAFLLERTPFKFFILLPLVLILVDYIENSHIAILLINFPEQMPQVAYTGSILTSLKWGMVGMVLMLVCLGFYIKNVRERLK